MNMMLHGIAGTVTIGDTLSPDGQRLARADVILTNPPFGTKKGVGLPSRDDFTCPTSNKQLAFLQHIYRSLKPGGRAAVVLPDNVLFESSHGSQIRADLMDKCNLHTILRREHFQEFVVAYGDDPNGGIARIDQGESGRFRCFSRAAIAKRSENLDISWLRDESLGAGDSLPEPEIIAAEIMVKLQTAMAEMETLTQLLENKDGPEV